MLEQKTLPYELLVRWDRNGAFSGAHVQHRTVISDGDTVITEKLGDAVPVTADGAKGFPLADILEQVHVDAIARCEALAAQVHARDAELASVRQVATEQAEQIARLQANLDAQVRQVATLGATKDALVQQLAVATGEAADPAPAEQTQ